MAIILSAVSLEAVAQKKVTSGSFNTLLKMMLKHDVREITVPEVLARKNAIFLDARERKEYDVSHIKNAVYVGYNNFDFAAIKNIAKGSEIIVYCSIGKRSEEITQKLKKAGYNNVSNLYGGIFEWVNLQNEVVDMNNKKTSKVHAYGRFWGQWLDKGEKVYN
jgi:rhodanese-related sulfurtransferase